MKKFFLLISALLLCGLLSSCALLPEEDFYAVPTIANLDKAVYTTAPCVRGSLVRETTVTFQYRPVRTASLIFEEKGYRFDTFFVRVGDTVEEGQLLAQMNLEDLEEKIADLESEKQTLELKLSQSEEKRELQLKRVRLQYAGKSDAELAEALASVNSQYDSTRHSLEDSLYLAELRLSEYRGQQASRQLFAPFSGVVTYLASFSSSEIIDGKKNVLTLSDSSVSLFQADTAQWSLFQVGDCLTVTTGGLSYAAHVIDPAEYGLEAEQTEGKTGDVYLILDEPAAGLSKGDYGKVTVILEEAGDTLYVPASAVSSINGRPVVYCLSEEGCRSYRYVTTGIETTRYIEILDGLSEGDEVIIH